MKVDIVAEMEVGMVANIEVTRWPIRRWTRWLT